MTTTNINFRNNRHETSVTFDRASGEQVQMTAIHADDLSGASFTIGIFDPDPERNPNGEPTHLVEMPMQEAKELRDLLNQVTL